MARGSEKHGPRVDDELKEDEHALLHGSPDEGRVERRRSEGPGPGDEADAGVRRMPDDSLDHGPSPREIEAKAAFAAAFTPNLFPAPLEQLLEDAKERFADENLVDTLDKLPAERIYENVGELWTDYSEQLAS